jgi:hypothetical protein
MGICCETHCCLVHGCKYCHDDCPVVSGEVKQKYLCQACSEEGYQDIPDSNVGYKEFLTFPCTIPGLPEGMIWREWLRELLIDTVVDPTFCNKTLNVNHTDWLPAMASDLSILNPNITNNGIIDREELNYTYRNLICVLTRDWFESLY